jgi:hypothetical protein
MSSEMGYRNAELFNTYLGADSTSLHCDYINAQRLFARDKAFWIFKSAMHKQLPRFSGPSRDRIFVLCWPNHALEQPLQRVCSAEADPSQLAPKPFSAALKEGRCSVSFNPRYPSPRERDIGITVNLI